MKLRYLAIATLFITHYSLLTTHSIKAQTLHGNVNVEGVYRAEVEQADRINTFPETGAFPAETSPLDIDRRNLTPDFAPTGLTMPASLWQATRPAQPRGYLDLSLGSWLNSSLSAGYTALSDSITRLDVSLQHNSTSLWRQIPDGPRRFRYDENIGARFSHIFSGAGTLSADLHYRFGYFNYYGYQSSPGKAPEQCLNDAVLRASWQSTTNRHNFEYHAALRAAYFGYSRYFDPFSDPSVGVDRNPVHPTRETHLSLSVGVSKRWKAHTVGGDILVDGLLYGSSGPESYARIGLNPYYRFAKKGFSILVGVDVNFFLNTEFFNPSPYTENKVGISPDIRLGYRKGLFALHLDLASRTHLRTLAAQSAENYYTSPVLFTTEPLHTPIDLEFGMDFGPMRGFEIGFDVGVRRMQNSLFNNGWYTAMLNYGRSDIPGLHWGTSIFGNHSAPLYSNVGYSYRFTGVKIGLHTSYSAGDIFKISARGQYMPQNDDVRWMENLEFDRWRLDVEAETHPIKPLRITLGYSYRGVREMFTADADGLIASYRLPDICSLRASASYDITERFTLGVRGDNLLNHRQELLPCLYSPGLDFQGFLTLRF